MQGGGRRFDPDQLHGLSLSIIPLFPLYRIEVDKKRKIFDKKNKLVEAGVCKWQLYTNKVWVSY